MKKNLKRSALRCSIALLMAQSFFGSPCANSEQPAGQAFTVPMFPLPEAVSDYQIAGIPLVEAKEQLSAEASLQGRGEVQGHGQAERVEPNPGTAVADSVPPIWDEIEFSAQPESSVQTDDHVVEPMDWWSSLVVQPVLAHPRWVQFDLPTLMVDTLIHAPRIQAVKNAASIRLEQVVQQDAAFDSRYVLEGNYGLTNDPVGNRLVTGGPPRLRERSFNVIGGIRRSARQGAEIDLSQELGFLTSNSQFFTPEDQGSARLSLSLTQPLLAGRGRVFNERLLVQASIDSRISWQQLRDEVTNRLAEVMSTYLQLHQQRCHLVQQGDLVERGKKFEAIIEGRQHFDVGRLAIVKIRQRMAGRQERLIQDEAAIERTQSQLRALVGSQTLESPEFELIPSAPLDIPSLQFDVIDVVRTGMENRPGVKSAMSELESAALGIRVTRNQLLPRLDAILNGYLAALNGRNQAFRSFGAQFYESGPGISAALQYEMPRGNRAARSRHREANFRYHQASNRLQETIQEARLEIETALVRLMAADQLRHRKRQTLQYAIEEEAVLTERYARLGPDGGSAALVLESTLDAQQRRTDAERTLVTAETEYRLALIELQRSMGTLLINEGIQPTRVACSNEVQIMAPHSISIEGFDSAMMREGAVHAEFPMHESAHPASAPTWNVLPHGMDQGASIDEGRPDS